MQERREAAHAIAALLDLAAVGVEDAVVGLGAGAARRLDHQRLVEADAGVARGQRAPLVGGRQPPSRGASKTMKSLPRPCILVNSSCMAGRIHYDSTGMRLTPWIVAALVLFSAWRLYSQRDIESCAGRAGRGGSGAARNRLAPRASSAATFALRPRADSARRCASCARGLFASANSPTSCPRISPWAGDRCPTARCSRTSKSARRIASTSGAPTAGRSSRGEIETHSANWHVIPGSEAVRAMLGRLRAGSVVELRGQLVDIEGREGGMKTSLSRRDTGAGACEILLAASARVLREVR